MKKPRRVYFGYSYTTDLGRDFQLEVSGVYTPPYPYRDDEFQVEEISLDGLPVDSWLFEEVVEDRDTRRELKELAKDVYYDVDD